jgi:hypothetical protein
MKDEETWRGDSVIPYYPHPVHISSNRALRRQIRCSQDIHFPRYVPRGLECKSASDCETRYRKKSQTILGSDVEVSA